MGDHTTTEGGGNSGGGVAYFGGRGQSLPHNDKNAFDKWLKERNYHRPSTTTLPKSNGAEAPPTVPLDESTNTNDSLISFPHEQEVESISPEPMPSATTNHNGHYKNTNPFVVDKNEDDTVAPIALTNRKEKGKEKKKKREKEEEDDNTSILSSSDAAATSTPTTEEGGGGGGPLLNQVFEKVYLHLLTLLTQLFNSFGWSTWTAQSGEAYELRNGKTYHIPQWYVRFRNWVAIWSFLPVVVVGLAMLTWVIWTVWPGVASHHTNIIHGVAILRHDLDVPAYVRRYEEIGQRSLSEIETTHSGTISDSASSSSASGFGLMFGVDEDNNDLDDDIESHAMEQLIDDAIRKDGTTVVKMAEAAASPASKAAPIMSLAKRFAVEPTSVCGAFTQFDGEARDFRRVRGCFDTIKFMLDRLINPRFMIQQIDSYLKTQEPPSSSSTVKKAAANAATPKKYVASRSLLNRDSAVREVKELRSLSSFYDDDKAVNCICSDHLGVAESFIYVGKKDQPALFIIEPVLEPLIGKQLDRLREGGNMPYGQFKYQNTSLHLDATDRELWRHIHYSPLIRQPMGIRLSYKTLPDEQTMLTYYGGIQGDPIMAYLNAYASHKQVQRNYENNNETFFQNQLNSISHWLEAYRNPFFYEREAYVKIMEARLETQSRRLDNERQRQRANSKSYGQMATEFLDSYGYSIKLSSEVPARIPPLEVKRGVLIENTEYSGCILHCMALREGLQTRRQQWRNAIIARNDPTAVYNRPAEPERIIFRFS